ncbi:MAG: hypothetical protein IPO92_06710 [Saprospiraceae bacterium]|nr:hypothetical protein [Saprospiraceae bacterium]
MSAFWSLLQLKVTQSPIGALFWKKQLNSSPKGPVGATFLTETLALYQQCQPLLWQLSPKCQPSGLCQVITKMSALWALSSYHQNVSPLGFVKLSPKCQPSGFCQVITKCQLLGFAAIVRDSKPHRGVILEKQLNSCLKPHRATFTTETLALYHQNVSPLGLQVITKMSALWFASYHQNAALLVFAEIVR